MIQTCVIAGFVTSSRYLSDTFIRQISRGIRISLSIRIAIRKCGETGHKNVDGSLLNNPLFYI